MRLVVCVPGPWGSRAARALLSAGRIEESSSHGRRQLRGLASCPVGSRRACSLEGELDSEERMSSCWARGRHGSRVVRWLGGSNGAESGLRDEGIQAQCLSTVACANRGCCVFGRNGQRWELV